MPVMGKRKKGSRFDRIVLWGIVVSVVAIALLLWGPFQKMRKAPERKPPVAGKKLDREGREHVITAVIAVVIDDLGQDLKPAQEVLGMPDRITLAVMPRLPQSKKIAELARQGSREVLVHIPMEAKVRAEKRDAPGTLRLDMTPMEFIAAVNEDLDSVPGAAGINNHEGSALTENKQAMTFLMSELKARNLFFLDSLTNAKSTAFSVAKEFGLKAAKRDVFLDNESDRPAKIRKQFDELTRVAKQNGRAIGIGHPHPATIAELRKWLAKIDDEGIEIVPVSALVK
ncbi:MAG: divergent polysaccharide deacetylase superfamily protein [Nitrospirae bacterium]|nr:divergent polysaccharide deacetylase superfamily protein [Nitrospirota bacterium]MBS1242483.1 divergent polysaccharide deacetylase superfamily protein [Nitrospirota bacterium]